LRQDFLHQIVKLTPGKKSVRVNMIPAPFFAGIAARIECYLFNSSPVNAIHPFMRLPGCPNRIYLPCTSSFYSSQTNNDKPVAALCKTGRPQKKQFDMKGEFIYARFFNDECNGRSKIAIIPVPVYINLSINPHKY